jgi:hypothetical protein
VRASVIAARVPPAVRRILIMHAEDTGRTLSGEACLWLQFGAASAVYVALHRPDVEVTPEVAIARAQARDDMSAHLAALLPHEVLLPVMADAAMAQSMN